ncbi:MAG: hypothetical protein K2P64_02395 [Lachnospiraceae bacterium]|nr:hypothetical protein [Lachnospiraceae bacterium]
MAMQINGNYDHSETDYAERVKEKQDAERSEKVKAAKKDVEGKSSGNLSAPLDEYISSERSGKKPTGLYQVGRDENGNRKIFFDDSKAAHVNEEKKLKAEEDRSKESADGKEPKINENSPRKPEEKCVTDTDKVDREIKSLKEKKQQLEQQIQSASGNEKKIRELEKRLTQVENELSQKDNDTYRRQNASVSE